MSIKNENSAHHDQDESSNLGAQYGSSLICVIAGPLSIAAILRIFLVEPCRRFLRSPFPLCCDQQEWVVYILIAIAVGTISPRRQESHPAHFHPPLNTSGIIIHR